MKIVLISLLLLIGSGANAEKLSSSQDTDSCVNDYTVCVIVSKAEQRLYAYYNGQAIEGVNDTPVSTARPGKNTPTGTFSIGELAGPNRVSTLYKGAALYYAMQLNGNIFIHGTSENNYAKLGERASAGCIRTTFSVAEKLNLIMRDVGGRTKAGNIADSSKIRVVVIAD
jgi:hypothetical protein